MIDGISTESADVLKSVMPEPTPEQYQSALQPAIQSLQDRQAAAQRNADELAAEVQHHINASNELSAHLNAQG